MTNFTSFNHKFRDSSNWKMIMGVCNIETIRDKKTTIKEISLIRFLMVLIWIIDLY